ncbi:hypothetical protein [Kitasatospora sp. NPDC094015]|uniref:hypothetical protein n=1 Tax=Kitasatospora sp. NPDC094015 TaxID=3155205 RepID=UPI0033286E4D
MTPACPQCASTLAVLDVLLRRNRWGGAAPRPRPERWWECPACAWVGAQHRDGEPLRTMRRLSGPDENCPFCGEEESSVVGEPWRRPDGELRRWLVCLACGTGNSLRATGD